jgi:uncharacterized membrane protein YfcA|tara:strand:- start:298 stop:561 length:264 start_codon:yes stop_codon:yes gene_type:complete
MYDFVERISETYILPALLGIIVLMWVVNLIYKPYGKKPRKASKLEKKIVKSGPFKFGQNVLFIIMFIFGLAIVIGLIGPGGGGWFQP